MVVILTPIVLMVLGILGNISTGAGFLSNSITSPGSHTHPDRISLVKVVFSGARVFWLSHCNTAKTKRDEFDPQLFKML